MSVTKLREKEFKGLYFNPIAETSENLRKANIEPRHTLQEQRIEQKVYQ
jgi:hypothetical protein